MIPSGKMIPFDNINAAVLSRDFVGRLKRLFPNGRLKGKEFVVGNLSGDPGDSLSINTTSGKWSDFEAGIGGPDPISLYATLYHNKERVPAARELGREFGLIDTATTNETTSGKVVHLRPAAEAKEEPQADDWQPIVPAPGDAPPPNLSGWDHVFPHYSEDGELLRYMLRNDATGDKPKVVRPLTWGTLNGRVGWHYRHEPEPRHLYGLDKLALFPNSAVFIVMGEKKAAALQRVFPARPVVTWSAGDRSVKKSDWSPLRTRKCVIWPDAGKSGEDAADDISEILLDLESTVWAIDVSDKTDGWDCDNAITDDGWEADEITEWIKPRLRQRRKEPPQNAQEDGQPNPEPPAPPKRSSGSDPLNVGSGRYGIVPLGHDRGRYYYLSREGKQVVSLSPGQHSKLELMALASVPYYWERTRFRTEKGAIVWDQAAAHLMGACHAVGIFDPGRIRGRGAWLDAGRSILHLGDRLLVNGEERDLDLDDSTYVYESAVPLSQAIAPPLPVSEAKKVLEIFNGFEWDRAVSARLAAGWVMVSPICGALSWRPNIWLTGPSGSGKTSLLNVITSCLGGMALNVQSKTSEAGIRQTLGSDARPVVFDEAEGDDKISKGRLQAVFDLVRQSSSEGGAEIVKGTANQVGSKRYRVRSCFAFSSINVSLEHQADENRISILSLATPPIKDDVEAHALREAHWLDLNAKITDTLTPGWVAGLIARSVRMAPVIRENAEIFAAAAAKYFGNRRAGDQLGAMLAGACALESDDIVRTEDAEKWLAENASAWDVSETDIETDEQRLLHRLLQVRVKVTGSNGFIYDRTVGELISSARPSGRRTGPDCDLVPQDQAKSELNRNGIRYDEARKSDSAEGIWVANKHTSLSRWLADTPWSAQWQRSLIRLPGAEKSEKVLKFSHGVVQRAVWLPISVALPDGDPDDM